MKEQILFLAFVLLSALNVFAQAEAYPAPSIHQCGNEVFDLTVQDLIILGNQSPDNYSVEYYLNQADAVAGVNQIVNAIAYVSPQQQTIFAKVVNLTNGDNDITIFTTSWSSGVFVQEMADVTACDAYELPPLQVGSYYLTAGGIDLLPLGTLITTTTTIYIYAENDFGCSDEASFVVTIDMAPQLNQPEPLYACDENGDGFEIFNLNDIIDQIGEGVEGDFVYTFHNTLADAEMGTNAIPNTVNFANVVPNTQTLYVAAIQTGTVTNCRWVSGFQIIAAECNDNSVSGFVSLNLDGDCDSFEAAASGIPVYYTHNDNVYIVYTNADGYYNFLNVPNGNGVVSVTSSSSLTVSPSTQNVLMPGNEEEVNFCITPVVIMNDVSVTLVPITQARAGFAASYAVIYQNLGALPKSGTITLQFDASKMTFTNALPAMMQSGNTLTLDYEDLLPLQTKIATANFMVMLPQVVPTGSFLNFTATITPLADDENPVDNVSLLDQIVVGSYDPNDIAVREGEFIKEDETGNYLNYTIRFQNKGTANAENVRIETMLDEDLDWATFEAIAASDPFTIKNTNGLVEFVFNGIDLPFESADEPASHGYVIYRIKPKATVTIGDVMTAQAGIYFDFNDVIDTNTTTTTVTALAGLADTAIDTFTVYPNPASQNVNLLLANGVSSFGVSVTDVLGKKVLHSSYQNNEGILNISALKSGIYFVSVTVSGKQQTKKLIVK
ncbi:T9SS type A sorting domain-containing protein [Flavobacterium sp. DG1-102-2]|uniref:T9SS type A sorting domain-containing protein n=1 Tax=Flavobacterium sp. DG1-102-2 TaxID=3081663 RepID=UPI00294909C4|nr:T9SS type A sorting domain-containing protein [Flavobacterium sp. DG1-102-2]MDV6166984.1 T9SS type A sorting domain-containing protein [Flavobacterium sp. DG1-102-2]